MDLNHLKFFYDKNLLTNLLIAEIVFNLMVAVEGFEPIANFQIMTLASYR